MPTPEEMQAAAAQIAAAGNAGPETPATLQGKELAETHAEVFVQRLATMDQDAASTVQFTMAYFRYLKENIDAGIMAL